jgi:hypothetical protein
MVLYKVLQNHINLTDQKQTKDLSPNSLVTEYSTDNTNAHHWTWSSVTSLHLPFSEHLSLSFILILSSHSYFSLPNSCLPEGFHTIIPYANLLLPSTHSTQSNILHQYISWSPPMPTHFINFKTHSSIKCTMVMIYAKKPYWSQIKHMANT